MRTTTRIATFLLVLAGALVSPAVPAEDEPPSGVPPGRWPAWLAPCAVAGVPGTALCGTYEVWEERQVEKGRRLGLAVLIVPAREEPREADPVFYFHGGPGASAVAIAGPISQVLEEVGRHRDLVFVDLRGTGGSHPLTCPVPAPDAPLQAYFEELLPEEWVRDCRRRQDADVGLYTTPIQVDDVDEVRAALGYDRINLYGTSGGTRTVQVYLRRHPEVVRTVVMKGVAPLDMENPLPFARALEGGMEALIAACAAEASCHEAYPELAADWVRSQERFAAGPVAAVVEHEGRREQVRIDRGVFADGVRHLLYTVRTASRLPGLIHAAAGGDFDGFAQEELRQEMGFTKTIAYGSFLTVLCAEDLRFVSEEDVERATAGTFLGDYRVRRQLAACAIWGWGQGIDASYQEPVSAGVPALLISGAVDTATPPEGGERVASHLPRALHVVFPNQSHGFANLRCESRLMADFIAAGSAAGLDLACVAETRRPPFVVPGES